MSNKKKIIFASCFLRSHFLFAKKNETPWRNGCSYEKGSLGRVMPSIRTLVGLLLALTWQAASALLELPSSTSSSWRGLCWQPDWAPRRLSTRAFHHGLALGVFRITSPTPLQVALQGPRKEFFAINDQHAAIYWLVLGCPWKACSRPHKIGQSPTRRFS